MENNYAHSRKKLVDDYIIPSGVTDKRVLQAVRQIPRHLFVPKEYRSEAYYNYPVSIGEDQTISQPSLVAQMTERLSVSKKDRILEIGTGSGYQTAILSLLAKEVVTIERIKSLYTQAKKRLQNLGHSNVICIFGDGYKGYKPLAPYDGIMVTAGAPDIPPALADQLKKGGRIVIPLEEQGGTQMLKVGVKKAKTIQFIDEGLVVFVPLVHGTT